MKEFSAWALWIFNTTYLFWGGAYFLQDLNFEFVIYVGVLMVVIGGVLFSTAYTEFPDWMLWLLSLWGILHILGGAVQIDGSVLFAYHIYPFLDLGGDFYVLKYDQVVHAYLYGVVAIMALYLLRNKLAVTGRPFLAGLFAVMASVGVSVLNEIMEFVIAATIERNGVGGYENAMLDLMFNLVGAVVATMVYVGLSQDSARKKENKNEKEITKKPRKVSKAKAAAKEVE
jgi:glycopeptide antibiotics resistance protein